MNLKNSNSGKRVIHILHSAALLSPGSGILQQMLYEQNAANQLGINWKVKMYCPYSINSCHDIIYKDKKIKNNNNYRFYSKIISWIKLRYNYTRWLLQQQDHVDIFLLRYYVHDPFQLWFVKKCKKPVFFLHHTLEVPELTQYSKFIGPIRSILELIIGRYTINNAKGIIGVTKEIIDYEVSRSRKIKKNKFIYPNGILIDNNILVDKRNNDIPEFIFIANFAPWHGLDILLKNVIKSNHQFVLHLVGKIPPKLDTLTNDPRVRVHGIMSQEQIKQLSAQCWVGLASFALFRNKMKQACPLKVREYLKLGLPVCGDFEDVFPADVKFYKKNDGDIDELINFAFLVRDFGKEEVREMAKEWIDKKLLLSKLYYHLTACNDI